MPDAPKIGRSMPLPEARQHYVTPAGPAAKPGRTMPKSGCAIPRREGRPARRRCHEPVTHGLSAPHAADEGAAGAGGATNKSHPVRRSEPAIAPNMEAELAAVHRKHRSTLSPSEAQQLGETSEPAIAPSTEAELAPLRSAELAPPC